MPALPSDPEVWTSLALSVRPNGAVHQWKDPLMLND
jgi:hypothetical protein